jgi:hypothetical protein
MAIQVRDLSAFGRAFGRLQRDLFQSPGKTITGVDPNNWPSALQPVLPIGPEGSQPLAIMLQMAQNLLFQPRADARYSAKDLKDLAQYHLARMCIDNTKDVLGDIKWKIQPKFQPGESKADHQKRAQGDPVLKGLMQQFEWPDGERDWTGWVRSLTEEMMSIDAAAILVQRTKAGKVMELVPTPGQFITCYVDDTGRTPRPKSPAYAQLWQGIPRIDLTTDQLIYRPRNIIWRETISSQLYGCGPTESLAAELEVGKKRLEFVDAFYSSGNLPNAMQIVPPSISIDKIKESQQWLNSDLAGQLAKRRQLRLIQGFAENGQDKIVFPEQPVLSDQFDELHIRKICFGYGTSPQRLMRMMNRASAQASQEAAEQEGSMPWMKWLAGLVNYIIQRLMALDGYEFVFEESHEVDLVKQMEAYTGYVAAGIYDRNEIREKLNEDERPEENAGKLGVFGPAGTGFIEIDAAPPAPTMPGSGGPPAPGEKPLPPGVRPVPRATRVPPQQVAQVTNRGGKKVLKLVLSVPDRSTY